MSNRFHLAHFLDDAGGIAVTGTSINATGHADFISALLRNFTVNELLEFGFPVYRGRIKPQHKVFVEHPSYAGPRSADRTVLAGSSSRGQR
jgi:hypothetical protein